jgi:hypothetical protein
MRTLPSSLLPTKVLRYYHNGNYLTGQDVRGVKGETWPIVSVAGGAALQVSGSPHAARFSCRGALSAVVWHFASPAVAKASRPAVLSVAHPHCTVRSSTSGPRSSPSPSRRGLTESSRPATS